MRKCIGFLLIVAAILLLGCEQIVCKAPYIKLTEACCLDSNNNNVCDKDEDLQREPEIITKEIEKIRYICPDGSEVEDKDDCVLEETEEAEDSEESYLDLPEIPDIILPALDTDNEQGTVIEEVTLKPACVKGENGGQVYFRTGTVPEEVVFQIKEVGSAYEDVFSAGRLYERITYFAICESCRAGDFRLKPDTAYVFRIMFNQTAIYNRIEYSNEHLIDTRQDSEYMLKMCGG